MGGADPGGRWRTGTQAIPVAKTKAKKSLPPPNSTYLGYAVAVVIAHMHVPATYPFPI